MSTSPTIPPKDWQNLYTEKQAHRDSLSQAGNLIVPVVFFLVPPSLFLILYIGNLLEQSKNSGDIYFRLGLGATAAIALLLIVIFGILHLIKTAANFLEQFHNLPAADVSKIVRLRMLGIPPLPPPLSNFFKFPAITAKEGKLDPADHWSLIVGGPVKLNIQAGHALYLEYGNEATRVVGQGSAFLRSHEQIGAVVHVGPHTREIPVTAWTKDGIKVELKARGEYFLGHQRTEDEENLLIPFDPEAVKKAVEFTFKSGKEINDWLKSATGQTAGILSKHISDHFLDDLFLSSNNNLTLLSSANIKELTDSINDPLWQKCGVSLTDLQILDISLPQKVKEQRVRVWEINHKNYEVVTDGEVKAHQIRMRERARAETQRDLIFTLASGLDRIDSSNFPEPLFLTISALLDQSMKDPLIRANLAKESLETLEKMQEAIKFPLQLPGEEL